jgi:hypothetical protein
MRISNLANGKMLISSSGNDEGDGYILFERRTQLYPGV